MINRRKLLMTSVVAYTAGMAAFKAAAKGLDFDVEPRDTIGQFERLPRLNLENSQDFYRGFRHWVDTDLARASRRRALEILRENGVDPREDIPMEQVVAMMKDDHLLGLNVHAWENTQTAMWKEIQLEYHNQADFYLEEMEQAEKSGLGSIELHSEMHIPQYASYEIHLQPGGYVGDPFAGYIYVHGENIVFNNGNYQDEAQQRMSRTVPRPPNGKVSRILEQGCSSGQFCIALKERFPEAEVWGSDVGAPMLRYAHQRSVDLGIETHYMHEVSEDSRFPDNHFDIVTNYILFHEIPEAVAKGVIKEAYRTLRPGGIFYPIDAFTANPPAKSAYRKFWTWRNYRWNEEVWFLEYMALDMAGSMRDAGFIVSKTGPKGQYDATQSVEDAGAFQLGQGAANYAQRTSGANIVGVKPA